MLETTHRHQPQLTRRFDVTYMLGYRPAARSEPCTAGRRKLLFRFNRV